MTQHEHIVELHQALVQTCIDFINKHKLDDIYGVQFQASGLDASAKAGRWISDTDSSLTVEGISNQDGISSRYEIGYSM